MKVIQKKNGQGEIIVAAMYQFVHLSNFADLRTPLLGFCHSESLKGTILLAEEGLNGTVAGTRNGIDKLMEYLRSDTRLAGLQYKESFTSEMPFYRMKVKLKKEIVSMGVSELKPDQNTGIRVNAREWNALLTDPEVLVIDTRNQYEHEVGTFRCAISPETNSFREFPEFVRKQLQDEKDKKVAMYCTGGIRCEKASAFLLEEGFKEVYQLEGGILKYLEEISPNDNQWQGECFVFDGRVAVDEDLQPGSYVQCFACRRPLSNEELASRKYQQGVSCPHCFETLTDKKKAGLLERQHQIELAEGRHTQHLGVVMRSGNYSDISS